MLRKLLYSTALILGSGTIVFAQVDRAPAPHSNNGPQSLSASSQLTQARKTNPSNQINALFDVQFNHDATAQRGGGAMAGVCWTGTEFWVSTWNADSLFTFDAAGFITARFRVPGVGSSNVGVRAMTWDGTSIFAATATNIIYEINPLTKTMVTSFVAPQIVRGLAFDSLADAGAGGFWISDFNSAISSITRGGTLLNTIPVSSHGLTGVYGIAIDNYSTGGPYIWAFDQGSSPQQSDLRRINIASMTTDVFIHNVMSDVGAGGSSGLAGGMAITWGLDPGGARSIIGMLQGTPSNRLFGYELNDYVLPAIDASADKLTFNPPTTFVPQFLVSPTFWDLDVSNKGANSIDTLSFILNIDSAGTNLFTDTNRLFNVASGALTTINTSAAFSPTSKGTYDVTAMVNTGVQTDSVSSNDTIQYVLTVTDSTLGMDNNIAESSLGLQASAGVLGQMFNITSSGYASSATAFFVSPTEGDSVSFDLYTYASTPGTILASTYSYVFTAADATNGVALTLGFTTAPFQLNSGSYFLGVNQFSINNISVGTTSFNFQPGNCQALFAGSTTWQTLDPTFNITFLLRLNILDPLFVGVPQVYKQDVFTMHPNPASSILTVKSKGSNPSAKLSLYDIAGREVFSKTGLEESTSIDLRDFTEGVYFVRMTLNGNVYSEKVTIAK